MAVETGRLTCQLRSRIELEVVDRTKFSDCSLILESDTTVGVVLRGSDVFGFGFGCGYDSAKLAVVNY